MKYLIKKSDLNEFNLQMNRFYEANQNHKFIKNIFLYYRKFRKFCFSFNQTKSITTLIKELYLPKQTFYYWAKRFYETFYQQKPWNNLLFKSTKPHKIHYFYHYDDAKKFTNYFIQYRNQYGIGAFQFCYLIKNVNDIRFNNLPKPSLKTIYRWLKRFNLNYQVKIVKKQHPRYEVKKVGLLQTDIKVISNYITGGKKWYILDYIDEKTRIVYSYPSQECQVIDVKHATTQVLKFYQTLGIKITRIRTDNGAQYTTNIFGTHRKNSWFTDFCKENSIVHETTPFRSPQSNGKIERFHRNWSNLFWMLRINFWKTNIQRFYEAFYLFY